MKILFRKILEYDLKKYKPEAFIYICGVLSQDKNPGSIRKEEFIPATKVVIHSELKRAVQCIKKGKSFKLISFKFLNEIPFDIRNYCNEIEFKKEGSIAVRKAFKKLFIEDNLMISRDKIFKEIKELFTYIENNHNSETIITVVSHSFRLKCIEAYLKTDGRIIKNPKLIEQYIHNSEKTFNFGAGFDYYV